MPNETILVIDSSFIAHRSRFVFGDLSVDDLRTGVIFGFLDQIRNIGLDLNSNRMVFCWDSKESLRKKRSAEYKNKRHKDMTERERIELNLALEQFTTLREEVLPEIGFNNQFIQEGYEADDIIASFVKKNENCLIVSSDQDLYQLLESADMYNVKTKKKYNMFDFHDEFGCGVSQWPYIKAVAGCKSDHVVGIQGVGEKSVIKYLNGALSSTTQAFQKIKEQSEEMVKKNMPLVKLPFRGTKTFKEQKNKFSLEAFTKVCHRYEFISFLRETEFADWKEFLSLGDSNGKH